jgi:hypothetical protein
MWVNLSGLTACAGLNKSWLLALVAPDTWSCDIPSACSGCGDVTLSASYADGVLTVSVGGYEWEIETDNPCQSQELDLVESAGGANPTCSVAPHNTPPCICACDKTCVECIDGDVVGYVEVVIDGLVDDKCSGCNEVNGTWLLPYRSCAQWWICVGSPTLCYYGQNATCVGLQLLFDITRYLDGAVWKTRCHFTIDVCSCTEAPRYRGGHWYKSGYESPNDCVDIDVEFTFADFGGWTGPICNWSGVTISVRGAGA